MSVAPDQTAARRHGWAWLGLTAALGVHVFDEAANDFLSFYNPTVEAIRRQAPYLPLPTFTFVGWLTGLIVAVILLAAVSPWVFAGRKPLLTVSYVFGILMLGNGIGHIALAIAYGRLMPGVLSAPLLLAAATWLLVAVWRRND